MFLQPGHDKPLLTEVHLNLLLCKAEKCWKMLDWLEEKDIDILILEYPHPCANLDDFLSFIRLTEVQTHDLMRQAVNKVKHCIDHDVCHDGSPEAS